jgi:hypothetical protein
MQAMEDLLHAAADHLKAVRVIVFFPNPLIGYVRGLILAT